MLYVHRSKQEVIYGGHWPSDQIVFIVCLEVHMLVADRHCLEGTGPTDTHVRVGVHMVLVVIVLSDAGRNGRMVADLLREVAIVFANQLEGLT